MEYVRFDFSLKDAKIVLVSGRKLTDEQIRETAKVDRCLLGRVLRCPVITEKFQGLSLSPNS